ncbi:hypothetical protein H0W26_03235, partial [Candidatus Dependentiae bacterium]|nr:hypothetical protein [Candidatus Dependentiae bacterium]
TARVWDVKTGQQLHILQGHTKPVSSAAFSPDGTTILTGSEDNKARLWDVTTGDLLKVLYSNCSPLFSSEGYSLLSSKGDCLPIFSSKGDSILTISSDSSEDDNVWYTHKTVRLWNRSEVSRDCIEKRLQAAEELFVRKFCPRLSSNLKREESSLSFTEAINLDNDSPKECSTVIKELVGK